MPEDEMEIVAEIRREQLKEQLFEQIVDLRDQGKSFREIAQTVGQPVRYIWDLLHDFRRS